MTKILREWWSLYKSSATLSSATYFALTMWGIGGLLIYFLPSTHIVHRLAEFLVVIVLVHLIFEVYFRAKLFREIFTLAKDVSSIAGKGIRKIELSGGELNDLREDAKESEVFVIGRLYRSSFIYKIDDILKARAAAGKKTTLVLLNAESAAADYLISERKNGAGDKTRERMRTQLRAIEDERNELLRRYPDSNIEIVWHEKVLRYSFFLTDRCLWVKPYLNASRKVDNIVFKLGRGTELFNFYHDDIDEFVKEAKHNG